MRAQEVKGLMEAYSQVYTSPINETKVWEEVESWVNSLIEEGHDLSEYTWEDMYEAYLEQLDEGAADAGVAVRKGIGNAAGSYFNAVKGVAKGYADVAGSQLRGLAGQTTTSTNPLARAGNAVTRAVSAPSRAAAGFAKGLVTGQGDTPAKPKMPGLPPSAKKVTQYPQGVSTGVGGGNAGASRATPAAKPAATPAAKPATTSAATTAPKPTTPAKPAGSAMDQFAKANPKLAAASAERDRTRGTSATTNPLMKDMKSSLPAPKSPAPSTAKTGFDLAKKGVNLAASVDIFDLVKGHLLDEGYADSEEGAIVMMTNMSEQWRKSILEAHGVEILDEISKELATKAFASRATSAFEMDDTEESEKADKTKERIVKKYGKKSGDEAEKAAERGIYGHNKYSEAQEREQAKRKATKVTKEDLQAWVGQLIAEGYDLSEYTWEEVAEMYFEELELAEAQSARENPEKYERSSEAKEGRRKRSGMNDPKTGINSPAFQAFMAQQMGGKKKKD